MASLFNIRPKLIGLPRRQKQLLALFADVVMSLVAMWLAFSLRLDVDHAPTGVEWIPYGLATFLFIPFFIKLGLYRAIFRYSGVSSLVSVASAVILYGVVLSIVLFIAKFPGVPRSIGILQPILFFTLVFGSRVVVAQLLIRSTPGEAVVRNVLIYGAGQAGAQACDALVMTPEYRVRGFFDDDPSKHDRRVMGYRVFDPRHAAEIIDRFGISDILIAVPSAGVERRRQIVDSLADLQVRVRTIPGILDLARGTAQIDEIQELQIIDLLDRAPIVTSHDRSAFAGKTVMVTGAGGSIGSELSRQLLSLGPAKLIVFDHNEFSLYTIDDELRRLAPQLKVTTEIVPCLGSIRDVVRIRTVMESLRPQLVYHAAAYKHVPLVEANPLEGATNNILGTAIVASQAEASGVERFTLISTDKAVRPTNFMGASKRLAEQIVQGLAAKPGQKTVYSMVRFGNVLGSSGSVVPLFRRQIAAGGPLTVTDPEVIRYFMTIPEAVGLVLHSSQMAEGGEVFVLDMGEPVKIMDLARKMIRLSGHVERTSDNLDGDIEIKIVGLRPGEKLYEELLIGDNPQPTSNSHIMMAREGFVPSEDLAAELEIIRKAVEQQEIGLLTGVLMRTVAGFQCGAEALESATGDSCQDALLARGLDLKQMGSLF
ncbi:nucleoside-diphosphate sugar epimerase/dehydratase [Aquamicrobium sp.]|uniref:polysaccharide biosynthesis protein n=1 Tax=Aquamicrobium sp. TaxID=1872579 RepID=UPI00258E05ED|nr:nucleoside-diphosphate sugar epimerase/dehydratase [Aquamicrobium sp.]MCK9549675.1 polysaccharide biosynthesis protein [Aquamicrobium sp.]